jgi:hypothetical protein
MATHRVLHVGEDDIDRLGLMRTSGLMVERIESSVRAIGDTFKKERAFSAVTFQEITDVPPSHILEAVRSHSAAPFVLFGNHGFDLERDTFPGLIIPAGTPSTVWLRSIHKLLAEGISLRAQSRRLRDESSELRKKSRALRARLAALEHKTSRGNKTFIVVMSPRTAGTYSVLAERLEIVDEHLVLLSSSGTLAGMFFIENVESVVQLPNPRDIDRSEPA